MRQRFVYLVRHGHYHTQLREEGPLDDIGEQQAHLTAAVLRDLPFANIYYSPVLRAAQTARIIAASVPDATLHADDTLRECIPSLPPRLVRHCIQNAQALPPNNEVQSCAVALDAAFTRYFSAPNGSDENIYDMLVCHGNVLRYLVARALHAGPDAWVNMLVDHCGITRIAITGQGDTFLLTHNDTSHLPEALRTEV